MTIVNLDLRTGARTFVYDLARMPFRSKWGAPAGELAVDVGPDGKITAVRASLRVVRRFVGERLAALCAERGFADPQAILRSSGRYLDLELALRPAHVSLLGPVGEKPAPTRTEFDLVMDGDAYDVVNVRIPA